ncbi:hypothetical protein [Polynucleobacter sp. 71A-WALBACH]|nr:hypothetical protein [Polynucleobacter sp. 71A-WALBACH]
MTTLSTHKILAVRVGHIFLAGRTFWKIGYGVHGCALVKVM